MKSDWSRFGIEPKKGREGGLFSKWLNAQNTQLGGEHQKETTTEEPRRSIENKPIEPVEKNVSKARVLKWLIYLTFIIYVAFSYFHVPILTHLGEYLVVKHTPEQSDLIVCLMGRPIERALETARLYEEGFAPRIFVAREKRPEGTAFLQERGISYSETRQQILALLSKLGVPTSAFVTTEDFVDSTFSEAQEVAEVVREAGYKAVIIVTSPSHTRRAWLVFKKVLNKNNVHVTVVPSSFTGFNSRNWWKSEEYVQEVIIEYQKIIYYAFKYLWF
jgi:uncharacterized SAM-binding protein YcdF (DUF218 family)